MAVCSYCHQEMKDSVSCSVSAFEGEPPRVPHSGPDKCHDCQCPAGGQHHPGCDMERCPICTGQAISCSCNED